MRKTLFLALLLALATPAAFAQTTPTAPAAKPPQYEHCMLMASGAYFARLDFGQRVKETPQNPELLRADEAVRKLRSVVAALNYLSSQGWEYISVNTFADGTTNPTTGYLLRRAK